MCLDIGGTNIKAGLITRAGNSLASANRATPANSSPELIARTILQVIDDICQQAGVAADKVDGVGISIAAFITGDGLITATAHLSQELVGCNIRTRLMQDLPTNYYFALDVPAPCLGEAYYGAGKGCADFAYVTVSTGIGAGVIAGGHYFTGGLGWAGGVGHIIIDEHSPRKCTGCGNYGCLETFAARQGIVTTAMERMAVYPTSRLHSLTAGNPDLLTPRLIYEAAVQGDICAREVFASAGHSLGLGLVILADIIAPTRIVVGGGIAQAGDLLLDPVREVIHKHAFPPRIRQVEIVQAALGDQSGIFGAAAMVFHDIRINLTES